MEFYKNGENMAFEVIYQRHKGRVYSYLNKRLVDKDCIEDIFQNIFIKFHNSRHLYNNKYPLLKWIYTICRSELLDSLKKNKVQFVSFDEKLFITELTKNTEKIDLDNINSLSKQEKQALKMRYYLDVDFSDISNALKTSEANSRKLVSRGIKKIKARLKGETK